MGKNSLYFSQITTSIDTYAPWDATVGSSPDGGGHEVPGEGGEPVGEHFVGCFKWDEREQ